MNNPQTWHTPYQLIIAIVMMLTIFTAEADAGAITIEAEKVTILHKIGEAEFNNNVFLTRDKFELHCDRLVAYYKDSHLDHADAFGHVRFKQEQITGSSKRAVLNQKKGTILLLGDATMQQNGNHIEGEQITHFIDQQRTIVKPKTGTRAHMVIESDNSSKTSHE